MQIILIIIGIAVVAAEVASLITLGPPWITLSEEYVREQIIAGHLNSIDPKILSTPNGMVSTAGPGLTGGLYYKDVHGNQKTTRIPWWTPLYRFVKARRAALMSNK